ncbi:MAG: GNAT family N-acetyltransferase [Anaerolineales bacterium]|nr:GNAT family N-acetyltransferase [Anaerolineales bacterium]
MKLTMCSYKNEEDYWRIREFLRQVMLLNNRRELSWHVARWDYWIWFANPDIEKITLEENVFIWETEAGQIAAVLNPEQRGHAFPQIHPDFHTPELDDEMIAVAEEHLTTTDKDGRQKLNFWIDSNEKSRQEILTHRGFHKVDSPESQEVQHRRLLDEPIPETPAITGYTIRSLGDGLELLERCYASGLGFHNDDIHIARDNRDHPNWYHHIQSAPLYRRDLDIVAVASDGSIASFCTAWFDDVSRTAYIEPMATVPAHQRHGLGKAVMTEGLHRLKRMGCKVAFVGGYSQAANTLYFSVIGPDHDISEPWEKVF